jgi:hypothetical protein
MSETPETDAAYNAVVISTEAGDSLPKATAMLKLARKLERERDELAALLAAEKATRNSIIEKGVKTERERDEAREQIDNIRKMLSESGEAVGNGEHDYSIIDMIENLIKSKDYFVRKSDSLERERDEALEALMKIEDVFVDGEDTYEGWRAMGNIAKAALEGKV